MLSRQGLGVVARSCQIYVANLGCVYAKLRPVAPFRILGKVSFCLA
jgi:hypothetical protein